MPGAQARLLHRVLGLVERGEHPVTVHVQFALVPPGEFLELVHSRPRSSLSGPVPVDFLEHPEVPVGVGELGERYLRRLPAAPGLPGRGCADAREQQYGQEYEHRERIL
jgi:hypothetical protein